MLQLATVNDIDQIMPIIEAAQARMKADGLIQWQDGYPNRQTIENDVAISQIYKLQVDGIIAGVCVVNNDYYEQYQNTPPADQCLIIHRVAVNDQFVGQGIGKQLINAAIDLISSTETKYAIVDTNSQNLKMIGLIEATGFEYKSDFVLVEDAPVWKVFVQQVN